MSEMVDPVDTEDVDPAEAEAADLVGEDEVSFDFQSVLDNLQNLWASDYARALLRDSQVLAQNGTLKRLLAEARQDIKAKDAVIEQLLQREGSQRARRAGGG